MDIADSEIRIGATWRVMKQVADMVTQGKQKAASLAAQAADTNTTMAHAIRSAEIVGAAKVLDHLAATLNSQAMRHWEGFQQSEGYLAYECKTFVEFLEKFRPMGLTKDKYYQRKSLLESEGDEVFDLLNQYGVPASARKQLTSGSIEISGNELVLNEQRVPLNDTKQVRKAISELVSQLERVENKSNKTEKEIEKLKKRLEKAQQPGTNTTLHDDSDPQTFAAYRLIAAYASYEAELAALDVDAANAHLERFRRQIQEAMERLLYQASNQRRTDEAEAAKQAAAKRPAKAQAEATAAEDDFSEAELADLLDD